MLNINNHPYHIVDYSPWPIKIRIIAIIIIILISQSFYKLNLTLLLTITTTSILIMYKWWQDVTREASIQGLHSKETFNNIKTGIILFITSEVLFFLSFFWIFIHSSLAANIEIGINWPPKTIIIFNPIHIPLLNTIILVSSGVTITASHHYIIIKKHKIANIILTITILLGVYFTTLQAIEYIQAPFSISDSTLGSSFFISTGFHGFHVIIGTIILIVSLKRIRTNQISKKHHFGFEARAWYWHFVDVVWLILYSLIYYWFF